MLISSVSGFEVDFAAGSYGAIKAALIHYAKGLSRQLVGKGIRVNCVSPGNTYFDGGIWQTIEKNMPDLFASTLKVNPTGKFGTADGSGERRGVPLEPGGEPHLGHQPGDRRRADRRRLRSRSHERAHAPATRSTATTSTTAGTTPSRPACTIAPGETVQFETVDASSGQLTQDVDAPPIWRSSTSRRVNPVTGPVYIDGAEAGRCAEGHGAVAAAFGLGLDRQHPGLRPAHRPVPRRAPAPLELRPRARRRRCTGRAAACRCGRSPARSASRRPSPACTASFRRATSAATWTRATSPRAPSSTCRSRSTGALFSVGDTHAAQGDGEVCGTAIESPIDVALKFELVKGASLRSPRYVTPGPVTDHFDSKGYEVTTGIGPDLMAGARMAVSRDGRAAEQALRLRADRRLHAVQRVRRPAHQLDRRRAELGRLVLLSEGGAGIGTEVSTRWAAPLTKSLKTSPSAAQCLQPSGPASQDCSRICAGATHCTSMQWTAWGGDVPRSVERVS